MIDSTMWAVYRTKSDEQRALEIDVGVEAEVLQYATLWGVTPRQIRRAVDHVGPVRGDVERFLKAI